MTQKRAFQLTFAVLALIPLSMGLLNIVRGVAQHIPTEAITSSLDSYHRFGSAWFLGLGVIVLWMLPRIEEHGGLFRVIAWLMFLGGIARVLSAIQYGMPVLPMQLAGALELCFPLFIWWHNKVVEETHRFVTDALNAAR